MDLMRWLRTLGRQWPVALILLLLTVTGAAFLAKRPGPYQSESQVVLLPSKQSSAATGNNPYLSFGVSLTMAADLVRREVMDPRTALMLAAQGFTSGYQVTDDPDTAGPVLDVTVYGSRKSAVQHTLDGVTAEVAAKLAVMQVGIKPADRITSLVVSSSLEPSLKLSQKARPIIVIAGLGLILVVVVPQLVDVGFSGRRSSRYQRRKLQTGKAQSPAGGSQRELRQPANVPGSSYDLARGSEVSVTRPRKPERPDSGYVGRSERPYDPGPPSR
jgi:hypothetical protein